MAPRPVIIDCDPGVDDATMLLLAFAGRGELDILGITVVAGNVDLAQTARNACVIREIAGRTDVPVHAGCPRPMVREAVEADEFHGPTGLGTLRFSPPRHGPAEGHAVSFLISTLREATTPVTLVVTGPATNLAMAIVMAPDIAPKVKEIVMMGGARSAGGNVTASAEYNVFADPHAAHVVMASTIPVVLFGLDACYQVLSTPQRIATLANVKNAAAQAVVELMGFSNSIKTDPARSMGAPLYDPCTIAWLLRPDLFTLEPAQVAVEIASPLTLGATAVDFRVPAAEANARWCVAADGEGVFGLLREALAGL